MQKKIVLVLSEKKETLTALRHVAKDFGMTNLVVATGISQAHIYHMLSERGNPTLDSLLRIAQALDVELLLKVPVGEKKRKRTKAADRLKELSA